jgi:DNA polymerase-3 subunit alpha
LVEQYAKDIIVLSGGLDGEITSLILNVGEAQAESALLWWKSVFNEDFYLEINRHQLEAEDHANEVLIRFSKAHGVKLVATNNSYYVNLGDANAHDVLLCVRDGELMSTPIGRGRGYRHGFENDEFYFKTPDQMKRLFADLPESILSMVEIIGKCEAYTLSRDVLLPKFEIPEAELNKRNLSKDVSDYEFLLALCLEGMASKIDRNNPKYKEYKNTHNIYSI